jgi:hypothetical protein
MKLIKRFSLRFFQIGLSRLALNTIITVINQFVKNACLLLDRIPTKFEPIILLLHLNNKDFHMHKCIL